MADWPNEYSTPLFLTTWSRYCAIWEAKMSSTTFAASSGGWNTANQVRYMPFSIPFPYVVRRAFWVNGSSPGGNWDIGIYTMDGRRLWSAGSTAGSGNSVPQFVSVSPVLLLPPGDFYLAVNHSATTANRITGNQISAALQNFTGIKQEALGSVTLPATATFAAPSVAGVPLAGLTWTDSGF